MARKSDMLYQLARGSGNWELENLASYCGGRLDEARYRRLALAATTGRPRETKAPSVGSC